MPSSPGSPVYTSTPEYSSTARSLALDVSPPRSPETHQGPRPPWTTTASTTIRSGSPGSSSQPLRWNRRRLSSSVAGSSSSGRGVPFHRRALRETDKLLRYSMRLYNNLTLFQKVFLSAFGLASVVLGILALIYSEKVFGWLDPIADRWKEMPGGWVILWFATFVTAFPPMFGYSTCVTLAGFVFGMQGWFIIATANVIGSLCSFLLFRHLLSGFATKLAAKDARFAAFGLVVAHDGLPILALIRLTPLPYAISNGGLSTVRTVKAWQFAVATAIATPKLLIHVFIGTRLKQLAGGNLDTSTKIVNWSSIAFGVVLGAVTGVVIYRRTAARTKVIQAEERRKAAAEGRGDRGLLEHPDLFEDDDDGDEDAIDVAEDVIDFIDGRYVDDEESRGRTQTRRYLDEESDFGGVTEDEDAIGLTRTSKS